MNKYENGSDLDEGNKRFHEGLSSQTGGEQTSGGYEEKLRGMHTFSPRHQAFLEESIRRIVDHYAGNLAGLAIFGSYARMENLMNSDLDLLIILNKRKGRRAEIEEFTSGIEMKLEPLAQSLYEEEEIDCDLSPIILSKEESLTFQAIYADMVEHCLVLHDPEGLIQQIRSSTKELLEKTGAKKIYHNGTWEWQFGRFLGGDPFEKK